MRCVRRWRYIMASLESLSSSYRSDRGEASVGAERPRDFELGEED